ncbi:MAG: DUF2690 domain-containing protein [Labedaea sp.]
MTRLHRMATVMAGVAGLTATLMLAAGPASATASVNRYEGLSPEITGCADDAVTIQRKSIIGSADIWLRYSPSCRTIWAHISGAPPRTQDNAGGSALIYREQDGAADRCNSGSNSSCSTAMLNDAGYTSHATGTVDTGFAIYRATTVSY